MFSKSYNTLQLNDWKSGKQVVANTLKFWAIIAKMFSIYFLCFFWLVMVKTFPEKFPLVTGFPKSYHMFL